MGRKGVSKRKKAKEKAAPVPASNGRKAEHQPDQVAEKGKVWPKDNRKH